MARLPRLGIPGMPQHVVQRGNNRQACFFCDQDRAFFINKLKEACEAHDVRVHAFVLMTNHVHILMTPSSSNGVSKVMQKLGRNYVRYINTSYGRCGTLWDGRYKSSLVQSSQYLLRVYQYIELNPVRAGMVEHPKDYIWSSYCHNAGLKQIQLIAPHEEYLGLGNSVVQRTKMYLSLFVNPEPEVPLSEIRHCLNKSKVLGNDKIRAEIEFHLKRRVELGKHGGDRRSEEFQGL